MKIKISAQINKQTKKETGWSLVFDIYVLSLLSSLLSVDKTE